MNIVPTEDQFFVKVIFFKKIFDVTMIMWNIKSMVMRITKQNDAV